jgi:hypothetical protein
MDYAFVFMYFHGDLELAVLPFKSNTPSSNLPDGLLIMLDCEEPPHSHTVIWHEFGA